MKRILIVIIGAVFLCGCQTGQNFSGTAEAVIASEKIMKVGYCPTMEPYALLLASTKNILPIKFVSSNDVLNNLQNNKIDVALIGRKAKQYEAVGLTEQMPKKNNFTLIGASKNFINDVDLKNIEVRSCLSKVEINNRYPELENIIQMSDRCQPKNKEVWLLEWEAVTDDMELLVVLDKYGNKVKKYRNPFLYGKIAKDVDGLAKVLE